MKKYISLWMALTMLFTQNPIEAINQENIKENNEALMVKNLKYNEDFLQEREINEQHTGGKYTVISDDVAMNDEKELFEEDILEEYEDYSVSEYEEEIRDAIENSDVISCADAIKIRLLDDEEITRSDSYIKVNNPSEIVRFLEEKEEMLENTGEYINYNASARVANMKASSFKTVNRGYSRGNVALKYNLTADIKYNTSSKVISKVSNRKFTITGITVATKATDRIYHTYYSGSKKYCKVTCNYTDVSYVTTPVGKLEILRKDAYQQFKWNYSKGVYSGKGGYGSADTSF